MSGIGDGPGSGREAASHQQPQYHQATTCTMDMHERGASAFDRPHNACWYATRACSRQSSQPSRTWMQVEHAKGHDTGRDSRAGPEVCISSLALDAVLDEVKKAAIKQKSSGTWMVGRKEMMRADKRTEKLTKSEQKDL